MLRRKLIHHGEAVVLIALGGILGANIRYTIGAAAGSALFVTLLVNTAGSFGLGLLLFDARADELLSKRFRYIFATGFLASFTTYSTFIADIALNSPALSIAYLIGSYATGFAGVVASRTVVRTTSTANIQPPMGDD
ncbi:MAG: CrcB family protein [Salinirussus sp.]